MPVFQMSGLTHGTTARRPRCAVRCGGGGTLGDTPPALTVLMKTGQSRNSPPRYVRVLGPCGPAPTGRHLHRRKEGEARCARSGVALPQSSTGQLAQRPQHTRTRIRQDRCRQHLQRQCIHVGHAISLIIYKVATAVACVCVRSADALALRLPHSSHTAYDCV